MEGARSAQAKRRQTDEMSALGSGNHYLKAQQVTAVYVLVVADSPICCLKPTCA